jgi:hypothetical protein
VWVASGFVGHGLNTTAMAGQLLGSAIVDNDDRWRLFLPFELIWAGGVAGRVFQQIGYWNHLRRERSSARRARRRDPRPRELPPLPADASEAVASTADAPKRVRRRRVTDAVSSAGGPADPEKRAPRARTTTSPSPSKATPSRVRQGGGTTDAPDTDTAPPVSIQPKAEPARRPVSRRRSEPMT